MEDPHRLPAQKSGQLEICELPIWIITPISKLNHWFPGVVSSASVAGVHIRMHWLSSASWCEMMVMQLVVKHTGLVCKQKCVHNTAGGSLGVLKLEDGEEEELSISLQKESG